MQQLEETDFGTSLRGGGGRNAIYVRSGGWYGKPGLTLLMEEKPELPLVS